MAAPLKAALSPSFSVVEGGPNRGRYVVAARSIKKNEVILKAAPTLLVIEHSERKRVCNYCLATRFSKPLPLRCEACQSVYYCSAECQALSGTPPHSKATCDALNALRLRGSGFKGDVDERNLCKIALTFRDSANAGSEGGSSLTAQPESQEVKSRSLEEMFAAVATGSELSPCLPVDLLVSNCDCFPPLLERHLTDLYNSFPAGGWPGLERSFFLEAVGRKMCNAFGFWDNSLQAIATGMFPIASMFNHSCRPTVCRSYSTAVEASSQSPGCIEFRALRDLEPGDELTLCYIDATLPREERLEILRECYFFSCGCWRCSITADSDPSRLQQEKEWMSAHLCKKCAKIAVDPKSHKDGCPMPPFTET